MSLTVKGLRAAVATNIATQITATTTQISPYILASPTFPSILVFPERVEYDLAVQRGLDLYTLTVQALVSTSLDQGAQDNLDALLAPTGSGSIKAAIESDRTLGGLASTLRVTTCDGYQVYKLPGGTHALGAEWTVQIWASGS